MALEWFKSYLKNQKLQVECTAEVSNTKIVSREYDITYGVSQGSCLRPLLFLVFCNDLPNNLLHCNSILFADNTTIYKSNKNLRYLQWSIQEELKHLSSWFKSNKLTLNPHKCVCMLFNLTKKIEKIDLGVDSVSLKQVASIKFLGVWIDDNLCWRSHLEKVIVKLKPNVNLLKVGQNFLNLHAKKLIYFAHIHSHMVYCLSIWGSMLSNTQIAKLQAVQDICINLIDRRKTSGELGILWVTDVLELE